jgi:hypothetical protein
MNNNSKTRCDDKDDWNDDNCDDKNGSATDSVRSIPGIVIAVNRQLYGKTQTTACMSRMRIEIL